MSSGPIDHFLYKQRKVEREMHEKMMEKMKAMEEKMKVMQESGVLEAQKYEMKQMFIDNLMKNQDVSLNIHNTKIRKFRLFNQP